MSNFSEHNDTGDPGRHDDALDGIVDESAIRHEQTIAELLEGDDEPLVEKLARLVTGAAVDTIEHGEPDAFRGKYRDESIDQCDQLVTAVGLRLLNIAGFDAHELVARSLGDEQESLDGEQGIACRLRAVPEGFAEYAHRYIAEACSGTRQAEQHVAGREHRVVDEAELRHASLTEQSLHDFLDALLDSWQVSEITRSAEHARTISGYHFHNGWKHIRRAA